MAELSFEATIERPVEDVFEFVTDFENLTKWQPGISRVKRTSEQPAGVGSTWQVTGQALGRPLVIDIEIIDQVPNQLLAFRTLSGPLHLESRIRFQPDQKGTHVSVHGKVEPQGVLKLMGNLVVQQAEAQWETNIATLKQVLEEGG